MTEWHTYLCVVELRLHVQWLQNLIEKRLQTEHCSFLTLNIHLAEKKESNWKTENSSGLPDNGPKVKMPPQTERQRPQGTEPIARMVIAFVLL